ncbi:MAG TPA: ATP-binding protein [Kofleriaceae bacterium]|jgi:signal transduction histidine kinase/DNA-binding NarL/FixJ family response regulator
MKSARILVVDDDDHVRDALVDELGETYTVEAVASGLEAFDALATQQYDVIISDLKMPDHDGIEVLEFAKGHQRDAVRVLLTGYLDERAQRALLSPDAPYKVGKPWHDEIEVVVRRGLEQREAARKLTASVQDALSMASFDEELATTDSPLELSEAVVRRALAIEGVTSAATVVRTDDGEHPFTGGGVPREGAGWFVDLPLDADGDLRLRARGSTESARQLVAYMAHRAQRRCGVLEARVATLQSTSHGNRMNRLMRQATVGALTSSLLHDLASTMQTLSVALNEITSLAGDQPDVSAAVGEAGAAGEEAVKLFVEMRKFIRGGEVTNKPVRVQRLVDRATRLAGGYVRERAELRIGELADATVAVSEPLFLQVLVNLLRNAANASPQGGAVDLRARVQGNELVFSVCDDGPGVSQEIGEIMFEPFASGTQEGTGLGLAISAYVMQLLGGRLSYRKDPRRGACFTAVLPFAK